MNEKDTIKSELSPLASIDLLDCALKQTGFEICTFPPDEDECEICNKPYKQLYFRSIDYYHPNEGEYYCADCILAEV